MRCKRSPRQSFCGLIAQTISLIASASSFERSMTVPSRPLPSRLLPATHFFKNPGHEGQKFFKRVEVRRHRRSDVFDAALEPASLHLCFRQKLNDECACVLPSFHRVWRIIQARSASHDETVMLLWCFGNERQPTDYFWPVQARRVERVRV